MKRFYSIFILSILASVLSAQIRTICESSDDFNTVSETDSLSQEEAYNLSREEYEVYLDSAFLVKFNNEQLKDSSLLDKIYYQIYEAAHYHHRGLNQLAVMHLSQCLEYDGAQERYPKEYATVAYQLYRILYSEQKYDDAYHFLQVAHIYNPENTTYMRELAWFEFGIQKFENAINLLEKLNKLQPNNSANIYSLCQSYLKAGKFNKAIKQLDLYEHLEGRSIDLLALRTDIFQQAGKPDKAIDCVRQYIDNNPDEYLEANFLLAQIYKVNNNINTSLSILGDLNNKYPENTTILLSLAEHYKELSNDSLQEKFTLDAVNTQSLNSITVVKVIRPILSGWIQDNHAAKISSLFDSLNIFYPEEAPIVELQADAYKAVSDTAAWVSALYRLKDLKKDEDVDFHLVTLAEQQGDREAVRRLTLDGYKKFHNDRWAYYRILSLGEPSMKDSIITVSLELLPEISTPNIKSRVFQIVGDYYYTINDSIAMNMYDSCLVYDPKNSGALNNVAYNITKQPQPDLKRAEKLASTAMEVDPENIYLLDTYAWILFLQGDNFLSEFYFDKLFRLYKEKGMTPSIETLYHIGCLYIKTNRIQDAKKAWNEAVDIYDQNPEVFPDKEIISSMRNFLTQNYENK